MVKKQGGAVYLFAIGMRNAPTTGHFAVSGLPGLAVAEVLGENRKIEIADGKFTDSFTAYQVHLYRITR